MGRHGKGQLYIHTAGIPFYRSINKFSHLGKSDNLVHFGIYFCFGHTQNCPIEIDVLPTCHFTVETGSNLQHGGDPSDNLNFAFRRSGNTADNFQKRALTGSVASDNAQGFPFMNLQIDSVKSHKLLSNYPFRLPDF